MSSSRCGGVEGREHLMFSALIADFSVVQDWCVRCVLDDDGPYIKHKGKRRGIEDVQSAEGLL